MNDVKAANHSQGLVSDWYQPWQPARFYQLLHWRFHRRTLGQKGSIPILNIHKYLWRVISTLTHCTYYTSMKVRSPSAPVTKSDIGL